MTFPAIVACSASVGLFLIPFEDRELGVAALDYQPADWITGDDAANLTAELLDRGHACNEHCSEVCCSAPPECKRGGCLVKQPPLLGLDVLLELNAD